MSTPLSSHVQWLVASQKVTSSLLAGWPTADPFERIARTACQVAHADRTVVVVGEQGPHAFFSESLSAVRLPQKKLNLLRGEVRRSLDRLPQPLTHGTDLPSGPTLLLPLVAPRVDFGLLAMVRPPDALPFHADEVTAASAFARHATEVLAYLQEQREQQTELLQHDRGRIAANLHDLVIQQLFGMGLRLQSLTARVQPEDVAADLNGCVDQVDETIRAVRRSIFALRQPIASQVGLRSRILNVVNATPLPFEPSVHFTGPIDSAINEDIREELLISLGEMVTNVLRHAHASSAHIAVRADLQAQQAQLSVTDDGVGWNGVPLHGHGSANLLARALELGGCCEASMTDSGGTQVHWWVPLKSPAGVAHENTSASEPGREDRGLRA